MASADSHLPSVPMIFIYQIRSLEHKTEACPDLMCPMCSQQGGVHITVRQRYVWWLGPMLPSGKYGIAWCERCGDRILGVKWSPELTRRYKEIRSTTKTPLRLWRGMIVIFSLFAAIVLAALFFGSRHQAKAAADEKEKQEYITNPAPGDIYRANNGGRMYKIDETSATTVDNIYALYKVVRVSGDSVFVVQGNAQRVGTAENPVNPYIDGFWDELEKETTAFGSKEIAISHASMIKYGYFSRLIKEEGDTPGTISSIVRSEK
ncbi:hypothetical protein [Pedobacter sp. SYP-B3415]|uniref:hypothetical protein n=1 Tax=Pedobacter sp. SYP-B3415 TaxID=2496641 RepID=UPI00101DF9AF|nr:hypothetical protein [Pedobacter sp. SYP-B3415]